MNIWNRNSRNAWIECIGRKKKKRKKNGSSDSIATQVQYLTQVAIKSPTINVDGPNRICLKTHQLVNPKWIRGWINGLVYQ